MPFDEAIPRTCVVLNGRGFVGRSLVLRLLELGKCIVRVTDSTQSLQLDPSESNSLLPDSLSSGRAEYHQVDVRDISQIKKVLEGASTVFYVDATDLNTDDFYNCYMIIVQGAKNVVTACRECKVRRLVYNSTADVVFDGSHDIHNGDETLTCCWKFQDLMCDLKAQAEALVLFANNIDGLLTCALRPSNVFGPGDTQLVPLLVNLAKPGWTKFITGSGENMSDFTYVENVAHAHVCAAEALDSRMVSVAGMAFFITNLEPIKFWDFLSIILEGLGYQRPFIKLPTGVVWYIILLVKWIHEKLGLRTYNHSLSACYIVQLASRTRTFDCIAAQKHIGYSPVVSLEEGVSSTIQSFSHLARDSSLAYSRDFNEQSKVEKLLGGGKVADILLWKDEKKTFTYFLVLVLLFYWFFLGGSTLISSAAKLLLLLSAVLFGYGILPSNIFGFNVKRISPSCFELSETAIKDSIARISFLWNMGFRNIRLLAKGDDWNNFFKVAGSLYLSKLMLQSFTWSIGLALVFAFTAFFVYEQYEPEIDGLAKFLFNYLKKSKASLIRNVPAPFVSFLYDCKILHEHKAPTEGNDRKRLQ
ncbi:3beta-hydroxysteroid-dehydrogenase/decarboxylase isoform 3 [Citrus sinensis]|uniref:3beta-hydroxysteroid-dehydrogenase/decarboxylase isoform X1 n=1 Tax=Citrus sinensis TaxID=2711 RepID=UPI0021980BA4|nr:3beta-hydroxysteroid-dehydrogenase/decarboxylase isoform X1 [Citrus sinensis]KAH9727482.1 3beta-hydroxysteroid-dehydrogenase/decarboxylase isoform 3 [Citrus sinensis]